MKKFQNSAFTLVELIVVIVILAILATIAFLSFSSYSVWARDSVRLSDMTNISKWLVIQYTNWWKYTIPDNHITITASWVNIWYQWYAWIRTLEIANISSWKDPLDNVYYTYNTNINQNRFQLMWFLEDWGNISLSYINNYSNNSNEKVNADSNDYSKRFPLWRWDQLWILLNSGTQVPIQYNNSNIWFELNSATWTNYVAYLNKTITIQSTWSMIWWLVWFYTATQASSTYPGCDTPDIKLSNWQIWAACNVGATQAWNNQVNIQNCSWSWVDCDSGIRNTLWSYFQWWRNDDITSTTSTSSLAPAWTLANNVGHNYFIYWSIDWINAVNSNLWWWSWTNSTWWTYYTQWQPSGMQWPCASWYHVPTVYEWSSTIINLNPLITITANWQNNISIVSILKIPLAWYRYGIGNTYNNQNVYSKIWTSSSSGSSNWYSMRISNNQIYPIYSDARSNWLTVRCLRN